MATAAATLTLTIPSSRSRETKMVTFKDETDDLSDAKTSDAFM